jgi:PAS domain S-box-containing protein
MKKADKQRPDSASDSGSGLSQDLSRLAVSVESVASETDLLDSVARKTTAMHTSVRPPDAEQFLSRLLKHLPGTAYRCANDRPWTMEYLSESCEQLIGYPAEHLIGNRKVAFADLIHTDDRERVWNGVQQAVEKRLPFRLQYRLLARVNGKTEERWIRERGAGVFAPSGELVALEGFLQDISKQKALRAAVRQMRRDITQLNLELRRQDQDIEAFSFMCAHNLREPLRHLGLFSDLLEKQAGQDLPSLAKGHLSAVRRAADRMGHRIADVQALVFATRTSMLRETVPLGECVKAALESLGPIAERTEARIQVDSLPEVIGDPILLTRLFEHLLSNAFRFGGAKPNVHVTAHKNSNRWVFGVRDEGPGIDPRYHARIFRPFERLHADQTTVGNGMGLAICQSIVHRHEGKLWLWSEPGQGAHFQFVLGLTAEEQSK